MHSVAMNDRWHVEEFDEERDVPPVDHLGLTPVQAYDDL